MKQNEGQPYVVDNDYQRALALHQQGQFAQAAAIYDDILASCPVSHLRILPKIIGSLASSRMPMDLDSVLVKGMPKKRRFASRQQILG